MRAQRPHVLRTSIVVSCAFGPVIPRMTIPRNPEPFHFHAGGARLGFLVAMTATAIAGYLSRSPMFRDLCPSKYPGDALWAATLFFALGVVSPRTPILTRAAAAFLGALVVELSQLYHAPWIDAVRRTTIGHLFLGFTFSRRDIAAYAVGIAAATLGEIVVRRAARRSRGG